MQCAHPKSRLHTMFVAAVLSCRKLKGVFPEKWEEELTNVKESAWGRKGMLFLELPGTVELGEDRWWEPGEYN